MRQKREISKHSKHAAVARKSPHVLRNSVEETDMKERTWNGFSASLCTRHMLASTAMWAFLTRLPFTGNVEDRIQSTKCNQNTNYWMQTMQLSEGKNKEDPDPALCPEIGYFHVSISFIAACQSVIESKQRIL